MFGFGKKSEKEKLQKKHKKLMEEAYKLSHKDRTLADKKYAEADEISQKIAAIEEE